MNFSVKQKQKKLKKLKGLLLVTQSDESDSGDFRFQVDETTKDGSNVTNESCHQTNHSKDDTEGQPTTVPRAWWNKSEENLNQIEIDGMFYFDHVGGTVKISKSSLQKEYRQTPSQCMWDDKSPFSSRVSIHRMRVYSKHYIAAS